MVLPQAALPSPTPTSLTEGKRALPRFIVFFLRTNPDCIDKATTLGSGEEHALATLSCYYFSTNVGVEGAQTLESKPYGKCQVSVVSE